nr:phosphotransferase [Verminephrobacter aporrectodeae]
MVEPAFPGVAIEAWAPCLLGGSNSLFRFKLAGDPANYIVRICSRDPASCATEVAVLRLVRATVPVAEVIHVGRMPGDAALPYVISTWLDGITLAEALKSRRWAARALGEAVGHTLAVIGAHPFPRHGKFDGALNVTPWSVALGLQDGGASTADVALKYLDHHAGKHLGDARRAQVLELLCEYDAASDAHAPARLVHADFNPGNIIIAPAREGESRVAGVIDWEWAHAGSPLLDVAVLLRPRGLMADEFESAFGAAFVAAGGELPAHWRTRAATLDFLNLLELIDAPAPLEELRLTALRQLLSSLERQRKENT